ncbi:MAG: Asp/Glu racemase [Pseudomonadota bacterium]
MTGHLSLPALGLIALRVDETIERELGALLPPDKVRLHVSRIVSGDDLTPDSIADMEGALTGAAALLPPAAGFKVVGYGCTSATAQLGAEAVAARVHAGVQTDHVTDPLSAAIRRLRTLNTARIGIVSPYTSAVADGLVRAFEAAGIEVAARSDMGIAEEAAVVRIPAERITDAAHRLCDGASIDALFLSCTNLNTTALQRPLSRALGLPILSSNGCLAWDMARLAGMDLEQFQS